MGKENSLAKDIEELVNKSIEANKIFLSESSRIVRQFTKPGEKKTPNIFQANFLTDAFNAYTKLNIQHLKNMVDLGVSMVKKVGAQPTADPGAKAENAETSSAPSFVLEAEAEAGVNISLSFLLDNIKEETVLCNLVNSPYIFNADILVEENFITAFSPQSFRLGTDEQQRIHIDIAIPATAKPGVYISNVKVQGFEPAHFSIRLTVKEKSTKKAPNGRKKAGSK
jgi:hypothetical protein